MAQFPSGFWPEDPMFVLDARGGLIEFDGIVSDKGHYGHMGFLHRKVTILRIHRYDSPDAALHALPRT